MSERATDESITVVPGDEWGDGARVLRVERFETIVVDGAHRPVCVMSCGAVESRVDPFEMTSEHGWRLLSRKGRRPS